MKGAVKAVAHITGRGWHENIPRVIPKGYSVIVKKGSWPIPDVFKRLAAKGKVDEREMFRTFNMGIGLVLVAEQSKVNAVKHALKECYVLGEIQKGGGGVILR